MATTDIDNGKQSPRIHRRVVQPLTFEERERIDRHIWFHAGSGTLASLPDDDIRKWIEASPTRIIHAFTLLSGATEFTRRVRRIAEDIVNSYPGGNK